MEHEAPWRRRQEDYKVEANPELCRETLSPKTANTQEVVVHAYNISTEGAEAEWKA